MINLHRIINRCCYAVTAWLLVGCNAPPPATMADAAAPDDGMPQALNMRLVGRHDLQARSAYQPVVHAYDDRRILFVGHLIGESMNPLTGSIEVNGLSILDVTDPSAPEMLSHVPPTGDEASGTQHVQVCDGSMLPNGDPDKVYAVRTNGQLGWDLFDVTNPAAPEFILDIAETGYSSRPESTRGARETHKMQWDCETGVGYFNGTPEGWLVTRLLMAFDLSNPEAPRHIRDFGLTGWEPDAEGPFPPPNIAGLHQPFVVGNCMYLGYESGGNGVLQILDRDKFLNGDPQAEDPFAPTPENLLYPQISRLDMPSYWGVHTAKPVYGLAVPDYNDDRGRPCQGLPDHRVGGRRRLIHAMPGYSGRHVHGRHHSGRQAVPHLDLSNVRGIRRLLHQGWAIRPPFSTRRLPSGFRQDGGCAVVFQRRYSSRGYSRSVRSGRDRLLHPRA